MLRVEEVGGLAVAFNAADEKAVDRELKRLDPNLFLDRELEPRGPEGPYVYYVVKEWIGDQHPPVPVLPWRDRNGPKPLTLAIVEHVKRFEKRDEKLLERIHRANREHDERIAEESSEGYDAITRDFHRASRNGGHFSGPVHRSRGLYLARARARSRRRR